MDAYNEGDFSYLLPGLIQVVRLTSDINTEFGFYVVFFNGTFRLTSDCKLLALTMNQRIIGQINARSY